MGPDRFIKITENQIKHMLVYKVMFLLFLFLLLNATCKQFWVGPISSFCLCEIQREVVASR